MQAKYYEFKWKERAVRLNYLILASVFVSIANLTEAIVKNSSNITMIE